jgi:ATP-dependent helicase IRC3
VRTGSDPQIRRGELAPPAPRWRATEAATAMPMSTRDTAGVPATVPRPEEPDTQGLSAQNGFQPRDYQTEATDAVCRDLAEGIRRTIVVLPTGTGKTVLFPMLIHRLGTPALILAHRAELLDQAHRTLALNGYALVGIEQGPRSLRGDEAIILASIPTLTTNQKRLERLLELPFKAILVDEVHHCAAPSWRKLLTDFHCFDPDEHSLPVIGFTATPKRGDRVGLHTVFQSIAYAKSLGEMIQTGWCAPLRAYTVNTQISLDGVAFHGEAGDFAIGELSQCVNSPAPNALAVEAWRRYNTDRRPTLVFATSHEHAKALAAFFEKAGVKASYVTDRLSLQERTDRIRRFKAGQIEVLVNVTIL